jgi:hypothetical protein
MEFLFSGDILRPAVIAIQAANEGQALAILEAARERGNLGDTQISVYDEDSDQGLATFHWDGEELSQTE